MVNCYWWTVIGCCYSNRMFSMVKRFFEMLCHCCLGLLLCWCVCCWSGQTHTRTHTHQSYRSGSVNWCLSQVRGQRLCWRCECVCVWLSDNSLFDWLNSFKHGNICYTDVRVYCWKWSNIQWCNEFIIFLCLLYIYLFIIFIMKSNAKCVSWLHGWSMRHWH